jgi:hypothetical protein
MIHVGELRRMLAEVPDVEVPAALDGLDASIAYLASDAALASLADDPYWPKHGCGRSKRAAAMLSMNILSPRLRCR